jgi:MYXO-CTERM domain-containing protein
MNAGAKMFRSLMLAGILISAVTGVAHAATDPVTCTNDIQCVAVPGCGGEVCDFINTQKCIAATGAAQTGWCTVTSDCKCASLGATCELGYCTFTTPPDGGASTGTAGTTAAGGAGGTTAAGGSGGSTAAGGAGGTGPKPSSSSSGCSVASSSTSGGFAAIFGLALVAGGLVRRRRRG